jgi:hypothetical protein
MNLIIEPRVKRKPDIVDSGLAKGRCSIRARRLALIPGIECGAPGSDCGPKQRSAKTFGPGAGKRGAACPLKADRAGRYHRKNPAMDCERCNTLLADYRNTVSAFKNAVSGAAGATGPDSHLAGEEAVRLAQACREVSDALMAHWRTEHRRLAAKSGS